MLIYAQEGEGASPCGEGAAPNDFDSSDAPTIDCSVPNDDVVPEVDLTINGTETTYDDSGQVLNTGGIDTANCDGLNESQQWELIGSSPILTDADASATVANGVPGDHSTTCSCDDPVNTATGEFFRTFSDVQVPGRGMALSLTRTYSSALASVEGPFGFGWVDSYGMSLSFPTSGSVAVNQANGSSVTYTSTGGGAYQGPSWDLATLSESGGTYTYARDTGEKYVFNSAGELTEEVDRNGYVTSLTYTGTELSKVTDPAGREITFGYNSDGLVSSVIDPAGQAETFDYTSGELSSVTNVAGGTWQFSYETGNLLTGITDPLGNQTTIAYNGVQVSSVTDGVGYTTSYSFGSNGPESETYVTDANGNETEYLYQGLDLLSISRGVGTAQQATTAYTYDPSTLGRATVTDPDGFTTSYTYDPEGQVTSMVDPLGGMTTYTYNSFGEQLTETDPLGNETSHTYDGSGNLLTTTDPLGNTTTYAYGDGHAGDVTSITNPLGHATTFTYDANGDLASVTNPLGETTTYTYDTLGRETSVTDPRGGKTSYTYDALGDRLSVTDPLGDETTYAYDADENLVSVTNPLGDVTSYAYDADNELTTTTYPDSTTSSTTYDGAGNVASTTDGNGNSTSYTYDALNRLASSTDALGRTTAYAYDGDGNLLSVTNASGQATSFTYDGDDQRTAISYSDGTTPGVTFAYDADGRRTSMIDGTGTTTYTYDADSRLASTIDGAGASVSYTYDADGDVTKITYPSGETVSYGFDAAGQMTSATDWSANQTTFSYDADGDLVGTIYPDGVRIASTFNANDQELSTTAETSTTSPTALASIDYTRDAAGLIVSETDSGDLHALTTNYTYDSLGRLAGVNGAAYSYDSAGNLTSSPLGTMTYDQADELTKNVVGSTNKTYSYDMQGNRSVTGTASNGITTVDGYNQANELSSVSVVYPRPAITSLSPPTGPFKGDSVTIKGHGFTDASSVKFGAVAAKFTVLSDSAIATTAPAGTGTDVVKVTTPGGTASHNFTYEGVPSITKLTPNAGPTKGGETFAIYGTNLLGALSVHFGKAAVYFTVASSGKIVALSSACKGTVSITVTTASGTSTPSPAFTCLPVPVVSKLSPASGKAGAKVTIKGSSFTDVTSVHFAKLAAKVIAVSGDYITATAPSGRGTVYVTVTTPGGTSAESAASKFTFSGGASIGRQIRRSSARKGGSIGTRIGSNQRISRAHELSVSFPISTYSYNGDGLRTSVTASGKTATFTWDTEAGLPLLLGDGTSQWIYGPGGEAIEQVTGTATSYFFHDAVGSTRAILSSSGSAMALYTFTPIGSIEYKSGTATSPILYAGQYLDAGSGTYYMRARSYDPTTGQFSTVDPEVNSSGQPYIYVGNNPVNSADPSGACDPTQPACAYADSDQLSAISAAVGLGEVGCALAIPEAGVAAPVAAGCVAALGVVSAGVGLGGALIGLIGDAETANATGTVPWASVGGHVIEGVFSIAQGPFLTEGVDLLSKEALQLGLVGYATAVGIAADWAITQGLEWAGEQLANLAYSGGTGAGLQDRIACGSGYLTNGSITPGAIQ